LAALNNNNNNDQVGGGRMKLRRHRRSRACQEHRSRWNERGVESNPFGFPPSRIRRAKYTMSHI
jgi:hypothetical protein